jgi:hypothetical protein
MRWPVALSFTSEDEDIARKIWNRLKSIGIGAYFYRESEKYHDGVFLFGRHLDVYASAHLVVILLRPQNLRRKYTIFEYNAAIGRPEWWTRTVFLLMESSARSLLPANCLHVCDILDNIDHSATDMTVNLILKVLKIELESDHLLRDKLWKK